MEAHVKLAGILLKQRQPADAEDALHAALEIDPSNIDALKAMTDLLVAMGRKADSEEYVRRVALLTP